MNLIFIANETKFGVNESNFTLYRIDSFEEVHLIVRMTICELNRLEWL